ncbi:hypothetical protein K9N50_13465 [bacterium]|nr:hypothetical protein [bacterium]
MISHRCETVVSEHQAPHNPIRVELSEASVSNKGEKTYKPKLALGIDSKNNELVIVTKDGLFYNLSKREY